MATPRKFDNPLDDPTLQALMTPSLAALARLGMLRRYAKGALLIEEGDAGETIYIILAGRLRAYSVDATNGRQITYGEYTRGEYIGEMSLDGGKRSASVTAVQTSVCSVVTRATLMQHLHDDPPFAFELLAKVIRRARLATLSARQMALNDVYGRLKLLLESLAVEQLDGRLLIHDPPTHLEVAHRLGCTREMVTRVMGDLKDRYLEARPEAWELIRPLPAKW